MTAGVQLRKTNSFRESQRARCQVELIGGIPPDVKYLKKPSRVNRARRAKKTPDRRDPKQAEIKEERTSVQADVEALVLCS
jgi:hypothetical protein